jgi:hypothetical protein
MGQAQSSPALISTLRHLKWRESWSIGDAQNSKAAPREIVGSPQYRPAEPKVAAGRTEEEEEPMVAACSQRQCGLPLVGLEQRGPRPLQPFAWRTPHVRLLSGVVAALAHRHLFLTRCPPSSGAC